MRSPNPALFIVIASAWWLMSARPASAEQLTADGREKRDLVFVDANTLVYVEQAGERQLAMMRLDLKTNASEPLHPDMRNNEFEPCFSADGQHYAFLQNVGNLNL